MTRRVIAYAGRVGRWQPGARERLERAALDLFDEQGFPDTTVPQITARAGLTTRTFFRYFADKREVLFAVEGELPALVERLFAEAPASLLPLELIERGLQTVATTRLESNVDYLRRRRAVIQGDEGLREREVRKLSVLSDAIARGFLDRGLDGLTATLSAHVAVTVFSVSVDRWLDQDPDRDTARPLTEILEQTLGALRDVVADHARPG